MSDSFDKLISDMRGDSPDVSPDLHDAVAAEMDKYADRLEALLAELEPLIMPRYDSLGVMGKPTDPSGMNEDPPLYRETLKGEPAPGSDWVLVDPVTGNGSGSDAP